MNGPQGDRRMDDLLARAAQEFVYPPTPALAAQVGEALAARRIPRSAFGVVRWAAVAAAIILGLTLAVPQTRAALYRVLQIGVVRIFLAETPTPSTAPMPTPQPTPLPEYHVSLDQLAGETTLEDAAVRMSAPILLPAYPSELGLPDRVFATETGGESVILVWLAEDGTTVKLALFALGPGFAVEKVQPQVVHTTTVRGRPAVWATGPYLVTLRSGNVDIRRLTGGHVLIWEEGGVTYRLETQADLEEARQIAESLEPYAEQ